jgi:hypothetical protein
LSHIGIYSSPISNIHFSSCTCQRVQPEAYEAIVLLGTEGQWQDWPGKWNTKPKEKPVKVKEESKSKVEKQQTSKGAAASTKAEVPTTSSARTSKRIKARQSAAE